MLEDITEFSAQTGPGKLSSRQAEHVLDYVLKGLPRAGRILLMPPDITRCYPYGGIITSYLHHRLNMGTEVHVVPTARTHRAMGCRGQVRFSGEDIPEEAFLYHDWRRGTVPINTIPGAHRDEMSGGGYTWDIGAKMNHCIVDGNFDLILSIGQVALHEVIGMSNYTKSILVGLGGRPMINGIHMPDVLYNLETIMGNTGALVRTVSDYGEEHFPQNMPLAYILTVTSKQEGRTALHGTFTGVPRQIYGRTAALAKRRCIIQMEYRAKRVVAYLEPEEFSAVWAGNKVVYRAWMVTEDGGESLVTVPGIKGFGEDPEMDRLICRYGYRRTPCTIELMERRVFPGSAMVPAYMIHSPSESRFTITYAVNPGHVSQEDIRRVGYEFMDVKDTLARYLALRMEDGQQVMEDGEKVHVVKTPALGLWRG